MVRSASPEPFIKRLVCTMCKERFDVHYVKDPVKPSTYTVTVTCRKCSHAIRVTIDDQAAARGEWTVEWPGLTPAGQ
jgi:RNase P subunit RPR2